MAFQAVALSEPEEPSPPPTSSSAVAAAATAAATAVLLPLPSDEDLLPVVADVDGLGFVRGDADDETDSTVLDLNRFQQFHKHALEVFELHRQGSQYRGRPCCGGCRCLRPVRFANRALEEQYQLWSSSIRAAAEAAAVILLAVMVLFFYISAARAIASSTVMVGCCIVLFILTIVVYALVIHGSRLPREYRLRRLDIAAFLSFIVTLAMLLLSSACIDSIFVASVCADFADKSIVGTQIFELLTMGLVLGIGFGVQVIWLLAANLVFIIINLWLQARFAIPYGNVLGLLLLHIVFGLLICYITYSGHIARRFDFHMLHRLSCQVRNVQEHAKALGRAQELTLQERSKAIKATTARETHQAIMGYTCHELRNPLHAIRGCLDELLSHIVPGRPADDTDTRNLQSIDAAYRQLSQVTDDVLDFNKLQSGKLRLRYQALNIRDLLGHIAQQYSTSDAPPIQVHVTEDTPTLVEADGIRLTQVITNGITNALKHAAERSVITVKCRQTLQVDETQVMADGEPLVPLVSVPMMVIEIHNVGTGLRGLDASTLFQPYERGLDEDSTLKGVGLGLPISKLLISMMGGDIGLEDHPGGVTSFWFSIPTSRSASAVAATGGTGGTGGNIRVAVPPPGATGPIADPTPMSVLSSQQTSVSVDIASESEEQGTGVDTLGGDDAVTAEKPWTCWGMPVHCASGRPLRVLVVDDQSINRRLLSGMIKRLGHVPLELSDGDEVMATLAAIEPPDICLLDIFMVRSNGLDTAQQMRAAGIQFPIIATTGNISGSDIQSYRSHGFDGVLGKPFTFAHVQGLVQQLTS